MQGHKLILPFHVPGTLTANITVTFVIPYDCRVKHVGACSSNDSDATLMLGISTDTNSILAAAVIGDSSVPVEKTQANFATTNPTGKLSKGEILVLTVDFDGATGTAADDLTVVITLLEG
jgi:hypothetical protein